MSIGPGPNPLAATGLDPSTLDPAVVRDYEAEIIIGRRAFSSAQKVFSRFGKIDQTFLDARLHWHGTTIDVREGSFAVVQTGSRMVDLVGEIVRVRIPPRQVYVYVVAESGKIDSEISLARRAFMAIAPLAQPAGGTEGIVEVMV